MLKMNRRAIASIVIAATASFGVVSVAFAQTAATPDAGTAMTKTQTRAAHKQARKAHRVAKNAELSKLEKNGYSPSASDPTYPNNLQAAQKKAGMQ
jgi:type IV secretory pathway VirB6-like protein